MRVRSKNHALELRDKSAQFFNQFGRHVQASSEASVGIDDYKAALRHLFNTINSFDYLFEAQVGTLEQQVGRLEAEKRRLERDVAQLQQALRAMKSEANRRARPPEKAKKAPADLRQERPIPATATPTHPTRRSAPRAAASGTAAAQEAARNGVRYAVKTLPGPSADLLRHFLQGQRNFLDRHSDAGVTGALSFLIQHALAQLQVAPQTRSLPTLQQAMYANLYTISNTLCTYKGQPLNGFQSAVEELERLLPGIADLAGTVPAKKKKRSEAKLFQETLKLLRDQARLDFRPYFYEIDPQGGSVFVIG